MKNNPEQIAADQLSQALLDRLADKRTVEVAASACLQSTLTKAAVQAVIDILIHKNVISVNDLAGALKHNYNKTHDQLTHRDESTIIVPEAAPVARPS